MTTTGETRIGRRDGSDVQLGGALVQEEHAIIHVSGNAITMRVMEDAITFVNGTSATHSMLNLIIIQVNNVYLMLLLSCTMVIASFLPARITSV